MFKFSNNIIYKISMHELGATQLQKGLPVEKVAKLKNVEDVDVHTAKMSRIL